MPRVERDLEVRGESLGEEGLELDVPGFVRLQPSGEDPGVGGEALVAAGRGGLGLEVVANWNARTARIDGRPTGRVEATPRGDDGRRS